MATEKDWERLRRPFDKNEIEKLPRYTGKKVDGKVPPSAYGYCQECGKRHPLPAVHLDYVGHAGITDRLNECDPEWNWEPLALDSQGVPLFSHGGMWIKLTVYGVTRYAFGDSQGKTGPNAVKEMIGDAIRNGAMRFGVGTYLWSKSEKAENMREFEEPERPKEDRQTLVQLYAEMGTAIEAWCTRHGRPEEAEKAKQGVKSRPEWEAKRNDPAYIQAIIAEFNDD